MSLTIEKFVTLCRGAGQASELRQIDQIVRNQLAAECSRQIETRWTSQPGIIRIRCLKLRLRINQITSDDGRLVRAWAELFVKGLFTALAYPAGAGSVEVVRAESRAEWLARFIRDLISGVAPHRWEYEEFKPLFGLRTSEAVIKLLDDEPGEIVPVLSGLERSGSLDRVMALFDELALERLFVAIARAQGATQPDVSIEDLLLVARFVIARQLHLADGRLSRQRQALHIFLALAGRDAGSAFTSPRRVSHALAALVALLELAHSRELSEWPDVLRAEHVTETLGRKHAQPVEDLLERIRLLIRQRSDSGDIHHQALIELTQALEALRPLAPATVVQPKGKQARWVTSDCAGIFLLVGLLIRLGWPERLLRSLQGSASGPRALTYGLAGLGLALLGKIEEPLQRIDPGLALFAGCFNEPDLAGLRRFLDAGTTAERLELLTSVASRGKHNQDQALEKCAQRWATTFDWLAQQLIGEFARRVRGFRQASRSFVVKNFLAIPGRIQVDEKRILVELASSPFHVALHISSADESVEGASWLDGRRLEFRLEGL